MSVLNILDQQQIVLKERDLYEIIVAFTRAISLISRSVEFEFIDLNERTYDQAIVPQELP